MTYQQSFHIDAPVTTVFGFFRDPAQWSALEPEGVRFKDVRLTKEGIGTHYLWTAKIAGVSIEGFNVFTDFVPDKLITDRSSNGLEGTWTYSFEPDGPGTRLTVRNQMQPWWRLPLLERLLDHVTARTHGPRFARLQAVLGPEPTLSPRKVDATLQHGVDGQGSQASHTDKGRHGKPVHARTIHIDAPVEVVFDHVKQPQNFVAADPEPVRLSALVPTPGDGIGSTWQTSWRVAGLPMRAAWCRRELVPGSRIVDHASTGVDWTYAMAPQDGGTALTLGYAISTGAAIVDRALDHVFGNQERQLDRMLANYKQLIEADVGPRSR
ncbi:SRPBCC family protein [Pedococcus sp. NPDC057267]|uniref:SRPBCC family protein n=1 Tax=Pedococcus sp. NPDC057267 TaxID=3346077 RepID=UPI00363F2339